MSLCSQVGHGATARGSVHCSHDKINVREMSLYSQVCHRATACGPAFLGIIKMCFRPLIYCSPGIKMCFPTSQTGIDLFVRSLHSPHFPLCRPQIHQFEGPPRRREAVGSAWRPPGTSPTPPCTTSLLLGPGRGKSSPSEPLRAACCAPLFVTVLWVSL